VAAWGARRAENWLVSRPLRGPGIVRELPFDQSNIARARALGRFLGSELDALSFTQELEDRAPD